MAATWQDDGVIADGPHETDLRITTVGSQGQVLVSAGRAQIAGFHFHLDAGRPLAFLENSAAEPRIDLVVLRLDRIGNSIGFAIVQGFPGTPPIPPPPTRAWATREIPLGTFQINPGTSSAVNLTDAREFVGKRIKTVIADGSGLPDGAIGYRPSDGAFIFRSSGADRLLPSGSSAGGVTVCTFSTRPAAPVTGQQIYETDTYRTLVWTGSAWVATSIAPQMSRRTRASQTITASTTAFFYFIDVTTASFQTGPGWGGHQAGKLTLPVLPITTYWQVTGTAKLTPVQSSSFLLGLHHSSSDWFAYDGSIGDDTTGVTGQQIALNASGVCQAPLNTPVSLSLGISRQGGTADTVVVAEAALSAIRIG
ncbi:hypothetical protein SAMN05421505_112116 [Sinosporangium album]|uniref:Uncharacterized protein n=2 Tax=Sinosporangium album TaxID=504805 RepID=A0A1G8ADR1_9ACTN|nr:hypothetical protein SAMN05421505_112116 [Sinosporangium album]